MTHVNSYEYKNLYDPGIIKQGALDNKDTT